MILDLLTRLTDNQLDNVAVIVLKFLLEQKWFVAALTIMINMFAKDGLTQGNDAEIRKLFLKLLRGHNV